MSASSDSDSGLEGVEQELLNLRAALGLNYRKVHKHLKRTPHPADCPPPLPLGSSLTSCAPAQASASVSSDDEAEEDVYIGGQHGAMPGAPADAAAFERFWAVLPLAASDDEGLLPPVATGNDRLPEQVRAWSASLGHRWWCLRCIRICHAPSA